MSLVEALEASAVAPHPLRLRDWRGEVRLGGARPLVAAVREACWPHVQVDPQVALGTGPLWPSVRLHLGLDPLPCPELGEPVVFACSTVRVLRGHRGHVGAWTVVHNPTSGALLARRGDQLMVRPTRPTPPESLTADATSLLRLLTRRRDEAAGARLLHGACVCPTGGDAVLLCGSKGGGKSTLMAALLKAGASYVAGDRTLIRLAVDGDGDGDGARLEVTGFVDPVRLGPLALEHLGLHADVGLALPGKRALSARALCAATGAGGRPKARLQAIIHSAWRPDAPARAQRCRVRDLPELEDFTHRDPTYFDWLQADSPRPAPGPVHDALASLPALALSGAYSLDSATREILAWWGTLT